MVLRLVAVNRLPAQCNVEPLSYPLTPLTKPQCRQDPNLGKYKDRLLGPKKDKYKVCSLLNKAQPNFGSSAAFSCQFCQALRYQNRSKGLVWHYIDIDAMVGGYSFLKKKSTLPSFFKPTWGRQVLLSKKGFHPLC